MLFTGCGGRNAYGPFDPEDAGAWEDAPEDAALPEDDPVREAYREFAGPPAFGLRARHPSFHAMPRGAKGAGRTGPRPAPPA